MPPLRHISKQEYLEKSQTAKTANLVYVLYWTCDLHSFFGFIVEGGRGSNVISGSLLPCLFFVNIPIAFIVLVDRLNIWQSNNSLRLIRSEIWKQKISPTLFVSKFKILSKKSSKKLMTKDSLFNYKMESTYDLVNIVKAESL